jgi:hypothetical protein
MALKIEFFKKRWFSVVWIVSAQPEYLIRWVGCLQDWTSPFVGFCSVRRYEYTRTNNNSTHCDYIFTLAVFLLAVLRFAPGRAYAALYETKSEKVVYSVHQQEFTYPVVSAAARVVRFALTRLFTKSGTTSTVMRDWFDRGRSEWRSCSWRWFYNRGHKSLRVSAGALIGKLRYAWWRWQGCTIERWRW